MENSNITLPNKAVEGRLSGAMGRMPIIAGNEVVNFALDNFRRQALVRRYHTALATAKEPH